MDNEPRWVPVTELCSYCGGPKHFYFCVKLQIEIIKLEKSIASARKHGRHHTARKKEYELKELRKHG